MSDQIEGDVTFFGYRTATVGERFMTVPRKTVDLLEEQLAKAAGVRPDNHTVYRLIQGDNTTCIWFHDHLAVFGRTVNEERW